MHSFVIVKKVLLYGVFLLWTKILTGIHACNRYAWAHVQNLYVVCLHVSTYCLVQRQPLHLFNNIIASHHSRTKN